MKIVEGERTVIRSKKTVEKDGLFSEIITYYKSPDKKVLEREDRFIITKSPKVLVPSNNLFFVAAINLHEFNIIDVNYGNCYFIGSFKSLEELSEAIIKEFEDFNVIEHEAHIIPEDKF